MSTTGPVRSGTSGTVERGRTQEWSTHEIDGREGRDGGGGWEMGGGGVGRRGDSRGGQTEREKRDGGMRKSGFRFRES